MAKDCFVNIHRPRVSYCWFRLVYREKGLSLIAAAYKNHGTPHLDMFEDTSPVSALYDHLIPYCHELDWALQHGIAPGQAFCVRIELPRSHGPDCSGEYAETRQCQIIVVQPWAAKVVCKTWEKTLANIIQWRALVVKEKAALEERRWSDTSALSIQIHWDDYTGEYKATLLTKHIRTETTCVHQSAQMVDVQRPTHADAYRALLDILDVKFPAAVAHFELLRIELELRGDVYVPTWLKS